MPEDPPPHDCDNIDCALIHQLLIRPLRDRSRRMLRAAVEHAEHNDGFGLVLMMGPGNGARPEVLYAGTPTIKEVVMTNQMFIFPQQPREGRNSGRAAS